MRAALLESWRKSRARSVADGMLRATILEEQTSSELRGMIGQTFRMRIPLDTAAQAKGITYETLGSRTVGSLDTDPRSLDGTPKP